MQIIVTGYDVPETKSDSTAKLSFVYSMSCAPSLCHSTRYTNTSPSGGFHFRDIADVFVEAEGSRMVPGTTQEERNQNKNRQVVKQ